jgi:hypothetical protein
MAKYVDGHRAARSNPSAPNLLLISGLLIGGYLVLAQLIKVGLPAPGAMSVKEKA